MYSGIISGNKTREALMVNLAQKVKSLGHVPVLAIVQVGDRADSAAFIRAKSAFGEKVGIKTLHVHLSLGISQNDLITEIDKLNNNKTVSGIIVQLPIPAHLDRSSVIDAISPNKDVDALCSTSVAAWSQNAKTALLPATARGVRELLDFYKIGLKGKKVAVIGRSDLVGKPVAAMCVSEGAEVVVCHSKTEDIQAKTKEADIVIVAVGKPKFFGPEYFRSGQVVVDVGINTITGDKLEEEISGKKLVGDVDFEKVKEVVSAITPVPGGVGPMTVLALFENVVCLAEQAIN